MIIVHKRCHDAWLMEDATFEPEPSFVRYPEADFDEIKAFRCSKCGDVIEIEL